jgi:hypothetical protein
LDPCKAPALQGDSSPMGYPLDLMQFHSLQRVEALE